MAVILLSSWEVFSIKTRYKKTKISRLYRSIANVSDSFIEVKDFIDPVLNSYTVYSRSPKSKEGKKKMNNIYRAKATVRSLIIANMHRRISMLTITFRDDIDYSLSKKRLACIIRKLKTSSYLWVAELTKKGRIHYHLLLFDYSMCIPDVSMYGFVSYIPLLLKPMYVIKYLCKSNDFINDLNFRIWSCGKGVFRPNLCKFQEYLKSENFGVEILSRLTAYGSYRIIRRSL